MKKLNESHKQLLSLGIGYSYSSILFLTTVLSTGLQCMWVTKKIISFARSVWSKNLLLQLFLGLRGKRKTYYKIQE